ncbi:MAG: AAA family ATPase, partial [Pseudomonadota bacterium]
MITRLSIENYRAIRSLSVDLAPITVVTGPNGSGKSTLYRALELIRAAAVGDLAAELAREGGMDSAMWAGAAWRTEEERETAARPRAKGPSRIAFGVQTEDLSYDLTLGLPRVTDAALALDPVVKQERLRLRAASAAGRRRWIM